MKSFLLRLSLLMLFPLLPLALVACGGSDDDEEPAPTSTNAMEVAEGEEESSPTMTGNWSGTFDSGVSFTMDLTQAGDVITGTYKTGAMTGSVSGTIAGNALSMTISIVGGATAQFTGAANDARTSMNGNFTIVAGGGGNGTWAAARDS